MPDVLPPNPYKAGKALGDEDGFFGREEILREVERTLSRSHNNAIVLYGQRRIGKTSILLQLQHRLPTPPFVPIYFDLMDQASKPVKEVLFELAVTAASEVGLRPPERSDFETNPEAFHIIFLPRIYQHIGDGHRLVFLLDEFDVLDREDEESLPETAAASALRPYLRKLMATEPRLAFVFVVGRRMDELSVDFLATFRTALTHPISLLHAEVARRLILQAQHRGLLRFDESAVERILALTRGHPYFVQLICQHVFDQAYEAQEDDVRQITVETVDSIIPRVLESGHSAFQWTWEGLPPAERIVFSAIASQGESRLVLSEDDITEILQDAGIRILMKELNLAPQTLVDWQMLEQVEGAYRFLVELMRRWVAEYQPLDKVKDELDRVVPLADSLYQAAKSYHQQERNQEAIAQLRRALEANPNHLKAHLLLGVVLREEGELSAAVTQFDRACRLDEREGRFELLRTLLQLGEAQEAAEEDGEALATYDRVLDISPRELVAQAHRKALLEKRGYQARQEGNLEAAVDAYRLAGSDILLAEIYEIQERWVEAVQVYDHLVERMPENAQWRQALERARTELSLAEDYAVGTGYVQQHDWERAQTALAAVIGKRPDYRDAAELLTLAKQKSEGMPAQVSVARRWLYLAIGALVTFFLMTSFGIWQLGEYRSAARATDAEGYAQRRLASQRTADASTAMAALSTQSYSLEKEAATQQAGQATAAEDDALERIAAGITAGASTRESEMHIAGTNAVVATETAIVRDTASAQAATETAHAATVEWMVALEATATFTAHATLVANYYEPNDTRDQAMLIEDGQSQTHTLNSPWDEDWLILETRQYGEIPLSIEVRATSPDLWLRLTLYEYRGPEGPFTRTSKLVHGEGELGVTCDDIGRKSWSGLGTYYVNVEAATWVGSSAEVFPYSYTIASTSIPCWPPTSTPTPTFTPGPRPTSDPWQ